MCGKSARTGLWGSRWATTGSTRKPPLRLFGLCPRRAPLVHGVRMALARLRTMAMPGAREFLAAAAWRCRFLGAIHLPALLPLLVLGLGGAVTIRYTAYRYLSGRGVTLALGGYVLFFIAWCVFALVVSLKDWRRETSGLLEEIRRRQQEPIISRRQSWWRVYRLAPAEFGL